MSPHGPRFGPGHRGGGPRGRGRSEEPPTVSSAEVVGWLVGRLPDDWFVGEPTVTIDRDEVATVRPSGENATDRAGYRWGRTCLMRRAPTSQRLVPESLLTARVRPSGAKAMP